MLKVGSNRIAAWHDRVLVACCLAVLGACSGSTGSGQFLNAPTAIATPIGYQPTSAAGASPVAITVRSGADVQLTGEDSDNGNISITQFSWQQTDSAPVPSVTLVYRNASTVSFTAPAVAADTTLNFQLSVTNAAGRTGTAAVQVLVKAADDSNRFLSLLATPRHFRAALGLKTANASAGAPIALSADLPVCVRLQSSISYLSRSAGRLAFALPARQVDAKWLASSGALAGVASATTPAYLAFRNPVVSFDLPILNDDLLFRQYNQPNATPTQVADQLVASNITTAYVPMVVSAAPGSCDGTQSGAALDGAQLVLQLEDEAGSPVGAPATGAAGGEVSISSSVLPEPNPLTPDGSAVLTPEDFLRVAAQGSAVEQPNTAVETHESATAYFSAIDPDSKKTTLTDWLSANCFDAQSLTFGAGESGYSVVHADYTNNYDLGFGRDMYFATCPNGHMAAVVVNYPTLEAAANRIGAFLAVAMEYTPPAATPTAACFSNPTDARTNTGLCFTKFYAFAPDDRTGVFERTLSANFDRRGPKYLPGACTVCHGGTPSYSPSAPHAPYPSGARGAGDIDSGFMPWDMGSFLFADTDPSFACAVAPSSPSCVSINPSQYTKAAQEPNIQQLNALAYRTWDIYSAKAEKLVGGVLRYQAPVDLVTKWYGGDPGAASAHAFDDSSTPSAWATPGQTAPDDLYHQVFAHQCRACHTLNDVASEQFTSYAQFALALAPNTSELLPNRLNVQQLVFGNAQMPLSRLTADRFWVDYGNGDSAAQTLAAFINRAAGAAPVAMDAAGHVVTPGQALVMPVRYSQSGAVTGSSGPTLSTTAANTLTRFEGLSLDALTQSVFAATYRWSLCADGPPATPGGPCPGTTFDSIGTPIVPSGASAGAAQTGASLPALATTTPGSYFLTLTTESDLIGATPVSQTYLLNIPQSSPVLATCPATQANFDGQPVSIGVLACFAVQNGKAQLGDPPYSLQISYDGTTYGGTAGGAGQAWSATVVPGAVSIDPNTGLNTAVASLDFNFTPSATGNATLYFQWCDGNSGTDSCVRSSIDVALVTGLHASPAAFLGYWDPTVNSNYGTASTPFTPLPSGGIAVNPTLSLAGLASDLSIDAPSATLTLATPSDGGSYDESMLSGSSSALMTAVSGLTYTPCGHFVTSDINGNALSPTSTCNGNTLSGGVAFDYSLSDGGTPAASMGTIDLRALASFQLSSASIFGTLGSTCAASGCHLSGGGGGTVAWSYTSSASATYGSITSHVDHLGHPLVTPGNPEQSSFYTAPCLGSDAAASGNLMVAQFAPTAAQCLIIYQWILEGGELD